MRRAKCYDGYFRLARDLGKHLHELFAWEVPLTDRQFWAWQAWLELEWNRPDRADGYAMQIAAAVYSVVPSLMGKRVDLKLDRFKLKYQRADAAPQTTVEQAAAWSKAAWAARLGGVPRKNDGD